MSEFNRRSFLKTTCISVGALYASANATPLTAEIQYDPIL